MFHFGKVADVASKNAFGGCRPRAETQADDPVACQIRHDGLWDNRAQTGTASVSKVLMLSRDGHGQEQ